MINITGVRVSDSKEFITEVGLHTTVAMGLVVNQIGLSRIMQRMCQVDEASLLARCDQSRYCGVSGVAAFLKCASK